MEVELAIGDYSRFTAYGIDGMKWKSQTEFVDEVEILESEPDTLWVKGWNGHGSDFVKVQIDPVTGKTMQEIGAGEK